MSIITNSIEGLLVLNIKYRFFLESSIDFIQNRAVEIGL